MYVFAIEPNGDLRLPASVLREAGIAGTVVLEVSEGRAVIHAVKSIEKVATPAPPPPPPRKEQPPIQPSRGFEQIVKGVFPAIEVKLRSETRGAWSEYWPAGMFCCPLRGRFNRSEDIEDAPAPLFSPDTDFQAYADFFWWLRPDGERIVNV